MSDTCLLSVCGRGASSVCQVLGHWVCLSQPGVGLCACRTSGVHRHPHRSAVGRYLVTTTSEYILTDCFGGERRDGPLKQCRFIDSLSHGLRTAKRPWEQTALWLQVDSGLSWPGVQGSALLSGRAGQRSSSSSWGKAGPAPEESGVSVPLGSWVHIHPTLLLPLTIGRNPTPPSLTLTDTSPGLAPSLPQRPGRDQVSLTKPGSG